MGKLFRFITFFTLAMPLFARADSNDRYIAFYSDFISRTINIYLIPALISVAFITFLYGVYKYFILGADEDGERATGKQFILWGITGLVIILSVWGIVTMVKNTLVPVDAGSTRPSYPTSN